MSWRGSARGWIEINTIENVFNVMVLIVAACLLGLISNTTLSNNSTQTHDLFRLYMIRSKQLFLNNWLWAWNMYFFEWLKFHLKQCISIQPRADPRLCQTEQRGQSLSSLT